MNRDDLLPVLLGGLVLLGAMFLLRSRGAAAGQSYVNEERWTIVRNERGRIAELVIHRDARVR